MYEEKAADEEDAAADADAEVLMDRRGFLKSLAGTAAVAVVPALPAVSAAEDDMPTEMQRHAAEHMALMQELVAFGFAKNAGGL